MDDAAERYLDYGIEGEPRDVEFKEERVVELAEVVAVQFGAKHNVSDEMMMRYLRRLADDVERSQEVM